MISPQIQQLRQTEQGFKLATHWLQDKLLPQYCIYCFTSLFLQVCLTWPTLLTFFYEVVDGHHRPSGLSIHEGNGASSGRSLSSNQWVLGYDINCTFISEAI